MSNETALSSLANQISTGTYQENVQTYTLFGTFTILTYASFLHFSDEVEFIWKAKFTLPTYLYFLSKYPVFFILSLSIINNIIPSESLSLCNDLLISVQMMSILPLFGTQGLISIRAYALCQGYRLVTFALSISFLAAVVPVIYISIKQSCASPVHLDMDLIHSISITFLDTLAFIVAIRQSWGVWRSKQSLGLQSNRDIATLLLQQGILRFFFILFITTAGLVLTTFSSTIGGDFAGLQSGLSSLLLCEFTLDLRRRNAAKLDLNQSALNLPTILFHDNPVQSIQSVLGRLHGSIMAEMGELNDPINSDDLGSGEPETDINGLQDSPDGTDHDQASSQAQLELPV